MGQRRTAPVVQHTIVAATPAGSIHRTPRIEVTERTMEYNEMIPSFAAIDNPRGRNRPTLEDLAEIRQRNREMFDMYSEDTLAHERRASAEAALTNPVNATRPGILTEGRIDEGMYGEVAQNAARRRRREEGGRSVRRRTGFGEAQLAPVQRVEEI